MANDIRPFRIDVPDSAIKTLKDKLALSTFPGEVDFSNDWGYGAPLEDVKRLANHWAHGFDWRAQEAKLNELPQFTTKIAADGFDELDIHFIHQKSQRAGSIPFLFVHGWPGHFLEVAKILPLLTNSEDGPSFHVVAPSLPNFGFSGVVKKKGFSIPQYAETMHKLMLKLGYDKYVTQGGDWGFIITRLIGIQYPESCLASHVNYVRTTEAPSFAKSPYLALKHSVVPYDDSEKAGLERTQWFQKEGSGYNLEQSTKPSTLGFALADSPVALLAWIYEKLHDWTDNYEWSDDEILTWISIYQFSTAGPAASIRIYYESKHAELERVQKGFEYIPNVHLGLSYFPKDLVVPPRTWGQALGPVVSESVHADGGHFAAHERPEQLVSDIKKMFQKDGGAYSVTQQFLSK